MIPKYVQDRETTFKEFLKTLGFKINKLKNIDLLLIAFTHKSYAADFTAQIDYNERLEFLGDSILGAVIAKKLFLDYPNIQESTLTLYKIALVREENLVQVAKDIQLDKYIILGYGEEKSGGRQKNTILADSLEALIGFMYIEYGVAQVEKFILRNIYTKLENLLQFEFKSYKSLLQEKIQELFKELPVYLTSEQEVDKKGNAHLYKTEIIIQGQKKSEGFGINKKKSQEEAAQKAYEQYVIFKK